VSVGTRSALVSREPGTCNFLIQQPIGRAFVPAVADLTFAACQMCGCHGAKASRREQPFRILPRVSAFLRYPRLPRPATDTPAPATEDPELLTIDLLVGASTIGVRVTRGDCQQFKSLTWTQIERAANNPLLRLMTK
jgi:hypothetical protein